MASPANGATDGSHASLIRTTSPRHSTTTGNSNPVSRLWTGNTTTTLNESSPLLDPRADYTSNPTPPLNGIPSRRSDQDGSSILLDSQSKSSWYMILLTTCMLGLQIAWSVETSYGSPYLLSLGISMEMLAFVWIAGPLSGVLVQPYVGAKSDRCTSRFGRRRPFMVGGAVALVISLLALAWSKEIVGGIAVALGGGTPISMKQGPIVFAVMMIYILNFSINTLQAGVRAFIVDNAPTHQQDTANAWATRLSGVGNITGFLFGFMDLPKTFGFFGATQFKDLCMLASIGLISTLTISCISISERVIKQDSFEQTSPISKPGKRNTSKHGLFAFFKDFNKSVRHLPKQIKAVCYVQFFAWIGWFPFLYYSTTYIGGIYTSPLFEANPNMSDEEIDKVSEEGTRVATRALFIFAITSFVSSIVLPVLVSTDCFVHGPRNLFSNGQSDSDSNASSSRGASRGFPLLRTNHPLEAPQTPRFTVRNFWFLSLLMYAGLAWCTFFISTTTGATVLVALIGIPWAMTLWAPFALIATEISRRNNIARTADDGVEAPQAGVVLGIHNVAISAPQVVATLLSSTIFRALQKPRGVAGDESVAWVLRFGGLCALVAAWLALRVEDDKGGEEDV